MQKIHFMSSDPKPLGILSSCWQWSKVQMLLIWATPCSFSPCTSKPNECPEYSSFLFISYLLIGLLWELKDIRNTLCKEGKKKNAFAISNRPNDVSLSLETFICSPQPSPLSLTVLLAFLCTLSKPHIRASLELELFMHVSMFSPGLWTPSEQGVYFIHMSHPHGQGVLHCENNLLVQSTILDCDFHQVYSKLY